MRSQDLRIDVTGTGALDGPLEVALTVHTPDDVAVPRVVAVGLSGGGYNRHYYDLRIDDASGYSEAEYHTARGWVFVGCDAIGLGESSVPPEPHTIGQVAQVQDAVARQVRDRLATGKLVDGLPAAPDARLLGLGQSMGGCFTIATQGGHGSYDAVGILGFSAIHTQLPLPGGGVVSVPTGADGEPDPEAFTAAAMAALHWGFHWEDVPADLVARDLASSPYREGDDLPLWASAPLPCAIDMVNPGAVTAQAAAISCPVLVAVGERDVVPDPRTEPTAYASSPDITVYVAPTMAHMHNFASTREQFWRRIHSWGDAVAG